MFRFEERTMMCLVVAVTSVFQATVSLASSALLIQDSPRVTKRDLERVEAGCSKGTLNELALKLPFPGYPIEAARKNIGGKVTIKVFVDERGSVYHAMAIDGPSLLRKAALRSARGAKFAPFMKDDQPIKCSGNLIYTFNPPNSRSNHASAVARKHLLFTM